MSTLPQNRRLVLVVERNMIVWPVLRNFLEQQGYAVEFAQDGADALARARDLLPPALVLTDIFLPKIDGLDLCRLLRSEDRTRGILIVVASYLDVEAQAKAAGADEFLIKPYDIPRLVAAIQRLLDKLTSG